MWQRSCKRNNKDFFTRYLNVNLLKSCGIDIQAPLENVKGKNRRLIIEKLSSGNTHTFTNTISNSPLHLQVDIGKLRRVLGKSRRVKFPPSFLRHGNLSLRKL